MVTIIAKEAAPAKVYHLNHFDFEAIKVPKVWIESLAITDHPAKPKPMIV